MAFLVMCAEKMRMLLRLFFITVCAWFYDWQRSGSLLEALRSIWQLDMTDSLVAVEACVRAASPSLDGRIRVEAAVQFFMSPHVFTVFLNCSPNASGPSLNLCSWHSRLAAVSMVHGESVRHPPRSGLAGDRPARDGAPAGSSPCAAATSASRPGPSRSTRCRAIRVAM